MNSTTQRGVRKSLEPMSIKLRVDHLDLHRKRLNWTCYADTLISKVKSILGNAIANIYTHSKFVKVYPITARMEARRSLIDFTDDVNIPETLLTYGAGEFTGWNTEFIKHPR